jgi:hypothetical protein
MAEDFSFLCSLIAFSACAASIFYRQVTFEYPTSFAVISGVFFLANTIMIASRERKSGWGLQAANMFKRIFRVR